MRRFAFDFNTWRDRLSLGQQIAIVMAILCLTLVLGSTIVAASIAREQAASRVEASMDALASNMAGRLDSYMSERFRDINDLAGLEAMRNVWVEGPDAIRTVLAQMQDSLPAYTWIGFARPDGTVVAATRGMLEGASVAERPWFLAGLKGPMVGDVHDAKLLASMLGTQANGDPFRFVDVAVPVNGPDGKLAGVLGAHMSWTWSNEIRDTLLRTVDPSLETSIWILRGDGRMLLGPDYDATPIDPVVLRSLGKSSTHTFIDRANGPAALTAVIPAASASADNGLGWIVVARRPLDAAFAGADQLALSILAVGLGLGVLGVGIAWLIANRMARPLTQLSAQVDRIGRDPAVTMIEREHGLSDVQILSASVRSLLRRIGSAEDAAFLAERAADNLQQKMDEKTRSLGEHISALQQLADTDPLTKLLNRRAFLVFAADAMNYYRRYGRGIGILVVDIDFFKRVNDTYGHGAGDDVIETVGRIIQGEVRTTDKVARFGGEEFVVLLRETEVDGAAALAERIRHKVAGMMIAARGHGDINVTVSIGLAMAEARDRDIADVIERADHALYAAKTGGRNQVVSEASAVAVAAE
jgi:diguanylate cyclase (GGDEF)-like protein